jgi:hypothetical protein
LRELGIQASSDTIGPDERQFLDVEYQNMLQVSNNSKEDVTNKGTTGSEPFKLQDVTSNLVNAPLEMINSNLNFFNIKMAEGLSASQLLLENFNQLETQVGNLATSFGGSRDLAVAIRKSIADAVTSVRELGGSLDDVTKIQTGIIKYTTSFCIFLVFLS